MPIYEYICRSCKKGFEKLILKESQSILCPYCQSEDLERVLSLCGVKDGTKKGLSDQSGAPSSSSSCASCISRNCSHCR
ncbi:MAG: FmdB family zinc ribbon protein [bacterium]